MVFLVPYDGSSVSEKALDCAVEYGKAMETDVVAVTFIPTGSEYAQRRKWIEPDEEFAVDSARAELKRKIEEMTDDAERSFEGSNASVFGNGVADRLSQVARDVDASVLFVGTDTSQENDDLPPTLGEVTAQAEYDVHLVRST